MADREPTVEEVRELRDVLEVRKREPGDIGITWKEASLAIKLCRHFLAEAERPKEMTAGEFAAKAIGIIRGEQSMNRESASQSLPGARDWYNGVHGGLEVAAKEIARFAAENNIQLPQSPERTEQC